MLSQFNENPKMAETLKDLVAQHKGKRWPEIAKVLENCFQIEIQIPWQLKVVHQDLIAPKPQLSKDQTRLMIELIIKHRSIIRQALPEFKEITKMEISRTKFCNRLYTFQRIAILQGIMVFMKNKTEYRKRLARFPPQSIGRILQCQELKSDDDPFTQLLKRTATSFEILLRCALDNEKQTQSHFYEILTQKMSRQDFFMMLNCISFMDDLRCIALNSFNNDEELLPDYFVRPTIQENKNLEIYQHLFMNDNERKFLMYHNSKHLSQESEFKLYFSKQIIPVKTHGHFQQKNARKKTVRGKITVNDKKYPSDKTIIFDEEKQAYKLDKDDFIDEEIEDYSPNELEEMAFGDKKKQ